MGPVCQTSLSTGLSKWELGPRHVEQSPTPEHTKTANVKAKESHLVSAEATEAALNIQIIQT